MPPRLSSSNFCSPVTPPFSFTPPTRSQRLAQQCCASRQFSHTHHRQITLRRRKFYEWLNGPGRELKNPLPGSTNYLGAYDKYGLLVRAGAGWKRTSQKSEEQKEQVEGVNTEAKAAEDVTPHGQENLDELEAAIRAGESEENETKQANNEKKEDDGKLPPETAEDLRPFPQNQYFRSQSVLSEELREAIYQRVKRDGATVSLASVEFGVSNERVGAVVRLKQLEKEWIAQGRTLAIPYSKAVLEMLPTTPHVDTSLSENKGRRPITHEPINDLFVHPATRQQLFVPIAESRRFTRVDAGKAFDNNLLPADARIPHPELIEAERELEAGLSFEKRKELAEGRQEAELERKRQLEVDKKQKELSTLKVVPQRRWDFVFEDVNVEDAGHRGRGAKAAGWRYGMPHEDRKRGIPKIPTKVEA